MFSIRKILQALFYLQNNAPKKNKSRFAVMYLLKLIFFADRYHIRHFGFIPSKDEYKAMKLGPVASGTYDVLKGVLPRKGNSAEGYLLKDIEELSENEVVIAKQEQDELSMSYKNALDFALKTYGQYDQFELSSFTHDYPEWKKHEKALNSDRKSIQMDLIDFFSNPSKIPQSQKKGIKQDPFTDDEEFLKAMRDDFSGKNQC